MSDDLVKQPALRRWQESVYGKGPYQIPDYESMAAIVQEHEQMADRIEELEAKLEKVKAAFRINMMHALPNYTHAMFDKDYAKMMGELDD
jgi:hypothetical protein